MKHMLTDETRSQREKLEEVFEKYKDTPGKLMPVLQEAQDIYGYLPYEIQQRISDALNIPISDVYGVASFYSQFNLTPKGKHQISVCLGTACYVKGASKVLERIEEKLGIKNGECTQDRLFSIDSCRCVGACGLAPVIMIDDEVYGNLDVDKVDAILDMYIENEKGGESDDDK